MAPPSGLHQSAIPSDFDTPFPALVRRPSSSSPSTVPPSSLRSHRADPSHLSPEDAYTSVSPPRPSVAFDAHAHAHAHARPNGSGTDSRPHHRIRHKDPGRPRSGRRRKRFQKLLWVKQSCRPCSPSPSPYNPPVSLFFRAHTLSLSRSSVSVQTPTTTPTRRPSSRTSSGTPASAPTTSGPWWPTRPSSCSTSAPSSSSSSASSASSRSASVPCPWSDGAASPPSSAGCCGTGG